MIGIRLLLVDDHVGVRRVTARLLRTYGFVVEEAEDAETALAALARAPADVVLADIVMPGKSGCWLIREVVELYPGTRCLLMSGHFNDKLVGTEECDESMPLIVKPFSDRSLGQRLRELMDAPPWHPTMKRRKGD